MNNRMKNILKLSGFILLVAFLSGCNLGTTSDAVEELGEFTLVLEFPDYTQHVPAVEESATASRALPKIIDPATDIIHVEIWDGAGTLLDEVDFTFIHEGDAGGGHWTWENGDGYISCHRENIALGTDRTIIAETFNSDGDLLTAGSITVSIDAFRNYYHMRLEPVDTASIVLDQTIYGSVDEGAMKFYRFDPEVSGRYLVSVHSEFNDVNLYLYRGAEEYRQSWFQSEPPIDEAIVFYHHDNSWEDNYYYVGVYGGLLRRVAVSNVDLEAEGPFNLVGNESIAIQTAHDYREIDLTSRASDASAVTIIEMIDAINDNRPWDIHFVDHDGAGHIVLESHWDSFVQVLPVAESTAFDQVWGASEETVNNFSVNITRFESETFEFMAEVPIAPETEFPTIVGDIATKQLWGPTKEYPFKEINLGFTFYYNGTPYTKIYVSPNGYISFWKYRLYYSWWYWHYSDDFWYNTINWESIDDWYHSYWWQNVYLWGWQWLYEGQGSELPNELVALYRAPFYFASNPEEGSDTGVFYQKRDSGAGKNEFVIEYKNMYHRYDPDVSRFDRYLSGQIILTEGESEMPVKDGTITLRYDRENTNMYGIRGFVGLENNSGEEILGPGKIPIYDEMNYSPEQWPNGLPMDDIQFIPATGGLGFVVE